MKYILNKKLLWTNIIICMILLAITLTQTGTNILFQKTQIIECHPATYIGCDIALPNGTTITVLPGQTLEINKYNPNTLNIANYGIWISTIIILIINHLIYNRKYPIMKKLKQLLKKIKEK